MFQSSGRTGRWRRTAAVLLPAMLLAGVPVAAAPAAAATTRLTPDGDVSNGWQVKPAAGPAWAALDDAITPPAPVGATDWIWAGAAGRVSELRFTSTTLGTAAVRSATVDYYANTGPTTQLRVDVLWRGAVRRTTTVPASQGFAWRQLVIEPRSQADLDDLRVRFTAVGGGDANVRATGVRVETAPLVAVLDWESAADRVLPESAPPGWRGQFCCAASSVDDVTTPVRAGGHAVRFELRAGDRAPNGWGSRSELVKVPNEPDGAERWYGFSTYLPGDTWQRDRSPEILAQWHQAGDTGSPPLSIGARNGNWDVAVDGVPVAQQGGDPAYRTDTWTDWVVHARWSATSNGLVEVWRNGTKVYTRTGAVKPGDGQGVYPKIGIYKWDWADTDPSDSDTARRVVFHDELRIGDQTAGYDLVVPR